MGSPGQRLLTQQIDRPLVPYARSVADAISRISIEQLKDLNRQILKVTIEAESI